MALMYARPLVEKHGELRVSVVLIQYGDIVGDRKIVDWDLLTRVMGYMPPPSRKIRQNGSRIS